MCNSKHKIKFCTCNIIKAEEEKSEVPKKKSYTTEEMFLKRQNELEMFLGKKKRSHIIEAEKSIEQGLYLKSNVKRLLQRYKGYSSGIIGITKIPSNEINDIITSDYILELLNSDDKFFDFEYLPKEKNILYISESYEYSYVDGHERPLINKTMNFKYDNNQWIKGRYSLSDRFDIIADGKIQQVDDQKHFK